MIRYQLACETGHAFESWFRDSAAFDDQAARGLLSCPLCASKEVGKALMAPRISKGGISKGEISKGGLLKAELDKVRPGEPPAAGEGGASPGAVAPLPVPPPALTSPEDQALRARLREVRDQLVQNSDYVGPRFATEARRMHEGEVEHRTIHGEASADEVRGLLDDGVPVHPLPVLPDERN